MMVVEGCVASVRVWVVGLGREWVDVWMGRGLRIGYGRLGGRVDVVDDILCLLPCFYSLEVFDDGGGSLGGGRRCGRSMMVSFVSSAVL